MTLSHDSQAYNVAESCSRLGNISRKTYYELIASGQLKTFKIGSRRYTSDGAIADFIKLRESEV